MVAWIKLHAARTGRGIDRIVENAHAVAYVDVVHAQTAEPLEDITFLYGHLQRINS